MKLHNTLLRIQDNKHVLDYWTEDKPDANSKQTVEVHESQIAEFEYLAAKEIPDHWSVKSHLKNHSIEIPADRVYIIFAPVYDSYDNCIGNKQYAWVLKKGYKFRFLNPKLISSSTSKDKN